MGLTGLDKSDRALDELRTKGLADEKGGSGVRHRHSPAAWIAAFTNRCLAPPFAHDAGRVSAQDTAASPRRAFTSAKKSASGRTR
jgi:hypothetical protein